MVKANVRDRDEIKLMIIDDNITCLHIVSKIFSRKKFQVQQFQSAAEALYALRESEDEEVDAVLIEIHVGSAKPASLNGLKFLEHLKKEKKNIPIFTMCAHNDIEEKYQSCVHNLFHIKKPITYQSIEMVRKKTLRKKAKKVVKEVVGSSKRSRKKRIDPNLATYDDTTELIQKVVGPRKKVRTTFFASTHDIESADELESEAENGGGKTIKGRLSWDHELHNRFLIALKLLGEFASPQRILEIMNVEGLSTKHIASHLQKHKLRAEKTMKEGPTENAGPSEIASRNSLPIEATELNTFSINEPHFPPRVKSPLQNITTNNPNFSTFIESNSLKEHFGYFTKSNNLTNEPISGDGDGDGDGDGSWGLTWKQFDHQVEKDGKEEIMVQNSIDHDDKDPISAMDNMFNEFENIDIDQLLEGTGDVSDYILHDEANIVGSEVNIFQFKEDMWFNMEELCKLTELDNENRNENFNGNKFQEIPVGENLSGNVFQGNPVGDVRDGEVPVFNQPELDKGNGNGNGNNSLEKKIAGGTESSNMDEINLMDYRL